MCEPRHLHLGLHYIDVMPLLCHVSFGLCIGLSFDF